MDCPKLSDLWVNLPCPSDRPCCSRDIYLEIGANIGACLMQMLAREDVAYAIAFEPSPANLFYLTSSVLANQDVAGKLSLYPLALGSKSGSHSIYAESGNAGNTVVDKPTHASTRSIGKVDVVTLYSVFLSSDSPPYIHLAKIDAQGYEVKILEGASKLLASGAVGAWKFELATDWLHAQGTSAAAYLNAFIANGYKICLERRPWAPLPESELRKFGCGPPVIQDFVAIRIAIPRQSIIHCTTHPRR